MAILSSMTLEEKINRLAECERPERSEENLRLLGEFREALNRGEIRVAEPFGQEWKLNVWVKKGLLLHLTMGLLNDVSENGSGVNFDLDTLPARRFRLDEGVRVPLGGSTIRDGSHLAKGVTCMPPVFVNMGVYVGRGSVLDSHALIGLCCQVGERVHIGPGTQVGGVVAPITALPTVINDDVIVGGNCGLYDGVVIGSGAVLAPGLILSSNTRVYDISRNRVYQRAPGQPLVIPAGAIVIPGARQLVNGPWAEDGLTVLVALIASYRDEENAGEGIMNKLLGRIPG